SNIESEGSGRNRRNIHRGIGPPQLHNCPLPILFFNLGQSQIQRALLIVFFSHGCSSCGRETGDYTQVERKKPSPQFEAEGRKAEGRRLKIVGPIRVQNTSGLQPSAFSSAYSRD